MNLLITSVFLGSMIVTSYRSVHSQTDSTPFHTSTGERVSKYGVAISQDMLCSACLKLHKRCLRTENLEKIHYGDMVYIEEIGYRYVNDVMNKKHKKRFDVWVETYLDEKSFDDKYKFKKLQIWKVKTNLRRLHEKRLSEVRPRIKE